MPYLPFIGRTAAAHPPHNRPPTCAGTVRGTGTAASAPGGTANPANRDRRRRRGCRPGPHVQGARRLVPSEPAVLQTVTPDPLRPAGDLLRSTSSDVTSGRHPRNIPRVRSFEDQDEAPGRASGHDRTDTHSPPPVNGLGYAKYCLIRSAASCGDSCAHTRTTVQPESDSRRLVSASRATLARIFSAQNSGLDRDWVP